MKKIRFRITALVGGSVLLLLLMIMVGFNIIIQSKIRKNAEISINNTLVKAKESTLYSPEMIAVYDNDTPSANGDSKVLYTQKEMSIIEWCEKNDSDKICRADTDGSSYYLMSVDEEHLEGLIISWYGMDFSGNESDIESMPDLSGQLSGGPGNIEYIIIYIDITGELDMIRKIDIVFIIAALVIGVFGSTAGYFIGLKLERSQLAQKKFFENTSHELKTPLTSIRGYAEGIEKGIITDHIGACNSISRQVGKMSGLIEEILCMAKLESGSVKLEKEQLEMSVFLQDCLMPFEGTVLARKLNVELELSEMAVMADPDKLDHAISNLLTNALKYAQTQIRISCGDGTVIIENDCEQLNNEELAHIFDRFYTGRDGNTGIGLSIAKEIIGLHNWKLTVKRTGIGIAFCIKCS
ncbi:MAG: HAMP domain-containing histidine kinase [Ruminococcus sp.]|nr:HAMP domain-containing histidine kinase [Ruminococcus sp.]